MKVTDAGAPSLYEILELQPGASEEEIRQAYKRLKAIYAPDSLVVYTLYTVEDLEDVRKQITEAYDTVIDPRTRREYDLSLFPDRQVRARGRGRSSTGGDESGAGSLARLDTVPEALPPDLTINPDTEFTGSLLRRIREFKGLDLRDISARTKISLWNLRAIENERFGDLPAPVYVRGFVTEIAKYLRLPVEHVLRNYMQRVEDALREASREEHS